MKPVTDKNVWQIELAKDPAAAEAVEAPEQLDFDAPTLIKDIRENLKKQGLFTIRGMITIFKRVDDDKNKQITAEELDAGLRSFGINLVPEQIATLVKHFDKDRSNTISFDELLTALRVSCLIYFGLGRTQRIQTGLDQAGIQQA